MLRVLACFVLLLSHSTTVRAACVCSFLALVHGNRYCLFVRVGSSLIKCVGSYFGIFPAFGGALCPFRETRGGLVALLASGRASSLGVPCFSVVLLRLLFWCVCVGLSLRGWALETPAEGGPLLLYFSQPLWDAYSYPF